MPINDTPYVDSVMSRGVVNNANIFSPNSSNSFDSQPLLPKTPMSSIAGRNNVASRVRDDNNSTLNQQPLTGQRRRFDENTLSTALASPVCRSRLFEFIIMQYSLRLFLYLFVLFVCLFIYCRR